MNNEEKLQHLRKMAAEGTPCFNKSHLKDRGWTPAMIRDLLDDVEIKYGATCTPLTFQYYYEVSRVEEVEKTKAFQDRKRQNEQRRQAIKKA